MKTLLLVSIIIGIGITLSISGIFYYQDIYTQNCEAEDGFMTGFLSCTKTIKDFATEEAMLIDRYNDTPEVKAFEKRDLSAIGWSTGKITKVVNSLAGQGVLRMLQARPAIYGSVYAYPSDPSIFVSLMEKYSVVDSVTDDKKLEKLFPQLV